MKRLIAITLAAAVMLCGGLTVADAVFLGSGIETIASGMEMVKTGIKGERICFSEGDFKSALAVGDFDSITVTELPKESEGMLIAAGRRVKAGQVIKRRNLGSLVFAAVAEDITESGFSFRMNGAGTGAEVKCIVKLIERANAAPTVPESEAAVTGLTAQSGIPLFSVLRGDDPEGDEIEFMLVGFPRNGAVRLTDRGAGRFEYMPEGDFVGYDEFKYVVRDEYGNFSDVASVSIRVVPRMSEVVFADMTDREEYGAAVAMSAMGVMSGVKRGSLSYFEPDAAVTRAEFVAMALKAAGVTPSGERVSFFDDDSEIPAAFAPSVAYAARCGIVDGELDARGLVFRPNEQITAGEAAVIMARIIGSVSDGEECVFSESAGIPVWAVSSVYAMYLHGIFEGDTEDFRADTPVCRAMTAEYLYRLASL